MTQKNVNNSKCIRIMIFRLVFDASILSREHVQDEIITAEDEEDEKKTDVDSACALSVAC